MNESRCRRSSPPSPDRSADLAAENIASPAATSATVSGVSRCLGWRVASATCPALPRGAAVRDEVLGESGDELIG